MSHFATTITTWTVADWIAFIGSVVVVSGVFFPALVKLTNSWFDWLGLVKVRQQTLEALSSAQQANTTANRNTVALADHAKRINGALDALVTQSASAAAVSALEAFRRTNSLDVAADAAQVAALQAAKRVKEANGIGHEPASGAAGGAPPAPAGSLPHDAGPVPPPPGPGKQ